MRVCNMVKKVGMKSVPPVVKETGLLFRSSKMGKRGRPSKAFPIRTMEIKTAVRNKTQIYWELKAKRFRNFMYRKKKSRGSTKLSTILRAKVKAIVDATFKNTLQQKQNLGLQS